MRPQLLESYTSTQIGDQWNDFVAVFLKNEASTEKYPNRILHKKIDYSNGLIYGENDFSKMSIMPEDKKKMEVTWIRDKTSKKINFLIEIKDLARI